MQCNPSYRLMSVYAEWRFVYVAAAMPPSRILTGDSIIAFLYAPNATQTRPCVDL